MADTANTPTLNRTRLEVTRWKKQWLLPASCRDNRPVATQALYVLNIRKHHQEMDEIDPVGDVADPAAEPIGE